MWCLYWCSYVGEISNNYIGMDELLKMSIKVGERMLESL